MPDLQNQHRDRALHQRSTTNSSHHVQMPGVFSQVEARAKQPADEAFETGPGRAAQIVIGHPFGQRRRIGYPSWVVQTEKGFLQSHSETGNEGCASLHVRNDLLERGCGTIARVERRQGELVSRITAVAREMVDSVLDIEPIHSTTVVPAPRYRPRTIGSSVMSEKIIWEYFTAPVLIHATKQILDNYGSEGWELVTIMAGPNGGDTLVAYFKRPKA